MSLYVPDDVRALIEAEREVREEFLGYPVALSAVVVDALRRAYKQTKNKKETK